MKGLAMSVLSKLLAPNAKRIRILMKTWSTTTLSIGKELVAAREKVIAQGNFKNPDTNKGWIEWVKKELGLSPSYVDRLIKVHKKFGAQKDMPNLSANVLIFLSHERNQIPQAVEEVLDRARRGEKIGINQSKKIVNKHRPSPAKANEIARTTEKPVLASDGYLYLGNTKEEVNEGKLRRTVVYDVRDAVHTLATLQLSPREFLTFALPHQLWKTNESNEIAAALEWLQELNAQWSNRNIEARKNEQAPAITH
jgi:hypothetical protein